MVALSYYVFIMFIDSVGLKTHISSDRQKLCAVFLQAVSDRALCSSALLL